MDEETRQFFQRQQQDPENQTCVDTAAANPQWASVSHGCYISLESSGVHRSLGVHISFVRSTTMDSWKPLQLRLMELGGNRRLRAHFRKHGVPDGMPIAEKYSTRAAEWYRRNLRALAEGKEPLEDLPEGTGHLPIAGAPSTTQLAFAKAAAGSGIVQHVSAGGAIGSDARYYRGIYHDGSASVAAVSSSAQVPGSAPQVSALPRRRMEGVGSGGPASASGRAGREVCEQEDLLGAIFGNEVGTKVSTGVWSAVGLAGSFASRARQFAEEKAAQAQSEGWLDSALVSARQGVNVAVETTTWVAQRGFESSGRSSYVCVGDGCDGHGEEAPRPSRSLVGSGMEWIGEQARLAGLTNDRSVGLEKMSTGRMEGFGPDRLPDDIASHCLPDLGSPDSPAPPVPHSPVEISAPKDSPPRTTMCSYRTGSVRELLDVRRTLEANELLANSAGEQLPAADAVTACELARAAAVDSESAKLVKVVPRWGDGDRSDWR